MAESIIKLDDELRNLAAAGGEQPRSGMAIPWTIFDGERRLLLRKGAPIPADTPLRELLAHAVYRTGADGERPARDEVHHAEQDDASKTTFFVIAELMARLNSLLHDIVDRRAAATLQGLDQLSLAIQVLCARDADAALAAIHLDPDGRYSVRHAMHCALLVELVAYRLGYQPDQRKQFVAAALTANVGMLELQERLQRLGRITALQRDEINQHPEHSAALLREAGVTNEDWLETVLQHHERMDGGGYPRGWAGERIHPGARVLALADIYHAKISERVSRPPMLPTQALRQMFLGQDKEVDQAMAHVFIKELGVYPPGAFVRLHNGELAVVTHRGLDGVVPRVASVISPRGSAYPRPLPRETSRREYAVQETAERDESILVTDLLPLWAE